MTEYEAIEQFDWDTAQASEIDYWRGKQVRDGEPHKRQMYLDLLEEYIGVTEGKILVDVGAGPKGILNLILFRIGIAIDPLMRKFGEAGYALNKEHFACIEGSGENIPLPTYYADQAYCLNALDHSMNSEQVFGEMVRILRPGGLLCIIVDFRLPEKRNKLHQICLSDDFFDRMEQKHKCEVVVRKKIPKLSGTANEGFLGVWRTP